MKIPKSKENNSKEPENTKEQVTESGDISEDNVLASLPAPVMTEDGSITWSSLTFPAGTHQLTWLQDLAGGKISENEVLEMIDMIAEKTRGKEREIQRRQNLEVEEAARGGNLTPVSGASRIVAGNPNLSEVSDGQALSGCREPDGRIF